MRAALRAGRARGGTPEGVDEFGGPSAAPDAKRGELGEEERPEQKRTRSIVTLEATLRWCLNRFQVSDAKDRFPNANSSLINIHASPSPCSAMKEARRPHF